MKDTALLLVDMQNAFCSKRRSFWKRGYVILDIQNVIRSCCALLSFARKNHWLIIFTKSMYLSDYSDAGLLVERNSAIKELGAYREGSWDCEIITPLKPKSRESVIVKNRYDPFYQTKLETVLRKKNIRKLVVGGLLMNVCVESAVRSAFDRDFGVVIVKEAVSTYSQSALNNSLKTIERHFAHVITLRQLTQCDRARSV